MNKLVVFQKEINYIKNPRFKESLCYLINLLPDYFFTVPASSTGKYHPRYALGDGGLVRHTKAAGRIAYELLNNPTIGNKYTDSEKELMMMALILHDGLKSGYEKSQYTKFEHPLLVAELITNNKSHLKLEEKELELLTSVIKTHMGPWTKDYDGNEVLPAPKTKYQNFVHMCDYLASRKCLLVPFDENNNIVE